MEILYKKLLKSLVILLMSISTPVFAATFVVDNNADTDNLAAYSLGDGTNTLRKCIRLANSNTNAPVVDNINFNLSGIGPFSIILTGNLPVISDPVYINGFSQPSSVSPIPYIMISASGASSSVSPINNIFYLSSSASNSIINGFSMVRTQNDAIYLNGASNCVISGCWIGLDYTASLPIQVNSRIGGHGIYLVNNSNNCTIGGLNLRNVISGNTGHGIVVLSSSGVNIINNSIGTSTNGNLAIGNGIHGISISNSTAIYIGNSNPLGSNLISGNAGIGINISSQSNNFTIIGNTIGTNLLGNAAIPNGNHGVNVSDSQFGIIGGSTTTTGNLISGNTSSGIVLFGASSSSSYCTVMGNLIGVNRAGTIAIPNGIHGISVYNNTNNTTIGGLSIGQGNLIAGNLFYGIDIEINSNYTTIVGNKIGTNISGSASLGNGNHGIYISTSNGTYIGGNSKNARNIISGNGDAAGENGISILNSNSNVIKGNFIGVSNNGLSSVGNYDSGISFSNSSFNTVGGSAFMERNVISGHNGPGGNLGIYAYNVNNSVFQSNFIGTDSTGLVALKNNNHGFHTESSANNNYISSNVVSGNGSEGFDFLSLTNSVIYHNFIGIGYNGTTKVANGAIGLRLGVASSNNTIGGASAALRNYISGNGNHAILFDGGSTYNTIQGNYVGTDTTGLMAIGNNNSGIILLDNSDYNLIGGSNSGQGNVFCCSIVEDGVRPQISSNLTIVGNFIGTNKNGVPGAGFGNAENGIWMMSYSYLGGSSSYSIIGGLLAGQANTITGSGGDGVKLTDYGGDFGTSYNPIVGNKIYCNAGLGINLDNTTNLSGENKGIAAPVVTSSTTNSVNGTGTSGNRIHIYRNSTSGAGCGCQGEIYIGQTTVVGGTWSFTHNLGLSASQVLSVTATQTDPNNNTSEFWACSSPLPVEFLSLNAFRKGNEAIIQFKVADQVGIKVYVVERSKDGIHFESIGSVNPNIESSTLSYQFDDVSPLDGNSYYRIQEIDLDGKSKYSTIVFLSGINDIQVSIYPNPAKDQFFIKSSNVTNTKVSITNTEGKVVLSDFQLVNEISSIDVSTLSAGVYFVLIEDNLNTLTKKLAIF
jgi:hypothetical protein